MAQSLSSFIVVTILVFAPILCFAGKSNGGYLYPQFYDRSCPKAQEIVKSVVAKAVAKEARMAASLLRLHFHDCFVKGCDASSFVKGAPRRQARRGEAQYNSRAPWMRLEEAQVVCLVGLLCLCLIQI